MPDVCVGYTRSQCQSRENCHTIKRPHHSKFYVASIPNSKRLSREKTSRVISRVPPLCRYEANIALCYDWLPIVSISVGLRSDAVPVQHACDSKSVRVDGRTPVCGSRRWFDDPGAERCCLRCGVSTDEPTEHNTVEHSIEQYSNIQPGNLSW